MGRIGFGDNTDIIRAMVFEIACRMTILLSENLTIRFGTKEFKYGFMLSPTLTIRSEMIKRLHTVSGNNGIGCLTTKLNGRKQKPKKAHQHHNNHRSYKRFSPYRLIAHYYFPDVKVQRVRQIDNRTLFDCR